MLQGWGWDEPVTCGDANSTASERARALVQQVVANQDAIARQRTAGVESRLERVLNAYAAERLGTQHFASLTGWTRGFGP